MWKYIVTWWTLSMQPQQCHFDQQFGNVNISISCAVDHHNRVAMEIKHDSVFSCRDVADQFLYNRRLNYNFSGYGSIFEYDGRIPWPKIDSVFVE